VGPNIVCESAAFRRAVETAARAVSSRSTLPALGTMLLQAEAGRLSFAATDLEIGIRTEIAAEGDAEVAAAVPARLLDELCPHLEGGPLELGFDPGGRTLALRCGQLVTSLRHLDAEEFPPGPVPEGEPSLVLPAEDLLDAIADVHGAASTDDARPVLTGVLVRAEEGRLTLAATNGYRLAQRWLAVPPSSGGELRAIVPARALAELSRALRGAAGEVGLSASRSTFFACAPALRLSSSLIEGTYPNYAQVIPTRASTTVTAAASELVGGLRAVAVVARDAAGMVILAAQPDGLHLEASATDVGEASTMIPARLDGSPIRIAFNGRNLIDALSTISGEAELSLDGPLSPLVVRRPNRDDFLHLVMPLRYPA
jgi:DNA polymerase-3 subunit beta